MWKKALLQSAFLYGKSVGKIRVWGVFFGKKEHIEHKWEPFIRLEKKCSV